MSQEKLSLNDDLYDKLPRYSKYMDADQTTS
jgi:hypothetical protein